MDEVLEVLKKRTRELNLRQKKVAFDTGIKPSRIRALMSESEKTVLQPAEAEKWSQVVGVSYDQVVLIAAGAAHLIDNDHKLWTAIAEYDDCETVIEIFPSPNSILDDDETEASVQNCGHYVGVDLRKIKWRCATFEEAQFWAVGANSQIADAKSNNSWDDLKGKMNKLSIQLIEQKYEGYSE